MRRTPGRLDRTAIVVALSLLVLPVLSTSAAGQFGIRGGMNLSKFVGSDAGDTESALGLNLGATIPLFKLGPIQLVPEVYYAQKGAKQTNPLAGQTLEFSLSYIEVPVLAKLIFPMGNSLSFYVAGGPAFAWNVDCSISATGGTTTTSTEDCSNTFGSFSTALEKADRGIVGSVGLDFTVGGLAGLNLDARVVRGLARLVEGPTGSDIKNQSMTLMLGYYLGGR